MQKLKIEDVQEILNHLYKGVEIKMALALAKSSGESKFTDDDDCFSLRVCKDVTAPYWEFCIHFKEHQVYFAVCGDTIPQAINNFNFELKRVLKLNTDADPKVVEDCVTKFILTQRTKSLMKQMHNTQPSFPRPNELKGRQTKEAVRYNQDKLRYDLIPPEFITALAEVFTFGAKKYTPNNWKGFTPEQQEEIKGSLLRHIYAYLEGEENDPESGLSHLAHAGCNLAFMLWFNSKYQK